jgi:hypothetical protein
LNIFGNFVFLQLCVEKLDRKIQQDILSWKKFIKNNVEKMEYTRYATTKKEAFEMKVESWWDN